MNSHTISAPEMAVAAHKTSAIAHDTGSALLVERASLTAAMAMIARTAGPTPRKIARTASSPWYSTYSTATAVTNRNGGSTNGTATAIAPRAPASRYPSHIAV